MKRGTLGQRAFCPLMKSALFAAAFALSAAAGETLPLIVWGTLSEDDATAARYVEILKTGACYEYAKTERIDTAGGVFYDS